MHDGAYKQHRERVQNQTVGNTTGRSSKRSNAWIRSSWINSSMEQTTMIEREQPNSSFKADASGAA